MKKKLYRLALITSPIVGMLTIVPLILFIRSIPEELIQLEHEFVPRVIFGLLVVSSMTFVQWIINIQLLQNPYFDLTKKPIIRYCLSFICTILTLFIFFTLTAEFRPPVAQIGVLRFYPFVGSIVNNSFILLIIGIVTTQEEKDKLIQQKTALEITNLKTQLEQLKQQIHPHFLFNCLSNLKALIDNNQNDAERYVDQLASFLRLSLELANRDLNLISEELSYLNHYISLQKVRFGNAIQFKINIPEDVLKTKSIPVFTLQILIENAIKHNAFSMNTPLVIKIHCTKERICVENNKIPQLSNNNSTKIGLANLSTRYKLLNLPSPIIEDKNETFKVLI